MTEEELRCFALMLNVAMIFEGCSMLTYDNTIKAKL